LASSPKKLKRVSGVDVGTIGVVGAIMLAVINRTCEEQWYQEPLVLAVPVASALVSNGIKWLWDVSSLGSAQQIQMRRCLNAQIKAVDKQLKSTHLTDEYKASLLKKRETYTSALIDALQYLDT
jgi:hypothetical protein